MFKYSYIFVAAIFLIFLLRIYFLVLIEFDREADSLNDPFHHLLRFDSEERFLWYSPHSGFGNQLIAFRNALRAAGILNRTLVVPPVFPHALPVYLGDCSGGHAVHPYHIRKDFWKALVPYLSSPHYTSIADVVDISTLSNTLVKTVDLRVFLALKCGLDVRKSLSGCSWCPYFLKKLDPLWRAKRKELWNSPKSALESDFRRACAASLGILSESGSKVKSKRKSSFFAVDQGCNTTVFFYSKDPETGSLSSDYHLKNQTVQSCPDGRNFTFLDKEAIIRGIRKRKKANDLPDYVAKNIDFVLGKENPAVHHETFLTFGSLFFYYDFTIPTYDSKIDSLSCATEFLQFVPPVMKMSQDFAKRKISGHSFVCSHFRGGDMAFKRRVREALVKWKKALAAFHEKSLGGKNETLFLMTDLRSLRWKREFSKELSVLGFKVIFADELRHLYRKVKLMVANAGRGLLTNQLPLKEVEKLTNWNPLRRNKISQHPNFFPNVEVILEQAVCSCGDLGFIGNPLSTISKNVKMLMSSGACHKKYE